jgi:hypothetical protein
MVLLRAIVLMLLAALCTLPAAAAVTATSAIRFSGLTLAPAAGTLVLGAQWLLQSFSSANNSLGESDSQFDATFSPQPVATAASVTWANASGSAAAPASPADLGVLANAASSVSIPGCSPATAFSEGHGSLSIPFTITGTGDVSVQLGAQIAGSLFVMTDACGLNAFTQTIFTLSIDGGDPLVSGLFDRRFLDVGPNSSFLHVFDLSLSRDIVLAAGVDHFLFLNVDSESSGRQVPEPPIDALLIVVGIGLVATRSLFARRRALDRH